MSGRLSDVEGRIDTVHKLASVISAMRGIAAARAQEARAHVEGIRTYARTIGEGISLALSLQDVAPATASGAAEGGRAVILIAAEQGFVGTYNERVFDAAEPLLKDARALFILGDRGLLVADEKGLTVDWSAAMISHPGQVPGLATRLTEAIFAPIAGGQLGEVVIVQALPGGSGELEVVTRSLVPFDYSRFPPPAPGSRPMLTLPPARLLANLVEEYIFSELAEALMLAFEAENEARMRAMIAARANVMETLGTLVSESRRLRQDEITDEIVELAAGASAVVR